METSREKAAGTIRLRYSRQFQSGGHAHTIDAECLLPVGASQETREQIVRELELSVGQLAHQVARQNARTIDAGRSQSAISGQPAQVPAQSAPSAAFRPGLPAREAESPPTRIPVSESMPTTPTTGHGRKITLPEFTNVIRKHWNMSPHEATTLLKVQSLEDLNYREAYATLKTIVERRNAREQQAAPSHTNTRPVPVPPEAPHGPDTHAPTNMASNPRPPERPLPRAAQQAAATSVASEAEHQTRTEAEPGVDFAGSPKAPIPIQFGTVREIVPPTYAFDEEEDTYDEPEVPATNHWSGKLKLDELKELRGNTAASAGRLKVLDNVMGSQVSTEQLQKIMQAAWGITAVKKLKTEQVEGLISWAKEDSFEEEVKSLLAWLANEEE